MNNIGDVVSINHNWFNGCDLPGVWHFLLAELRSVEAELAHLRAPDDGTPPLVGEEWNAQCELVMRANCGMALREFWELLLAKEVELLREGAGECADADAGRALLRRVSLRHIAAICDEMKQLGLSPS